ncbi:hypothetical protein DICSQDRAFT_169670 [Dichomitus squalens LYAD-421 SS1]|uniref:Uncharacterized protein n=1 Tax=Dichomitus squalens (strain LYAD-421) TaxID=732165 RepID=R7T272_DICSQ|nr:uncharacterized protein DICSQDRAFT_169670 [Dichomitus squalens LYAD-421 SS1]EJF62095.1 hypothetical protein DICSQDRAFT_169670 [Dichomitus squalens LYAD-421 SS1]
MNYLNKPLSTFSTNVVNPMYYVSFSTATIVASVILFRGFNTDDPANSISLLTGFITTFPSVHLEISRKRDLGTLPGGHHPHSALESGLMNLRLSIHGRMLIAGWNDTAGTPIGSIRPIQTLFEALEEDGDEDHADGMGLDTLHEAEDDELEADERTALGKGRN